MRERTRPHTDEVSLSRFLAETLVTAERPESFADRAIILSALESLDQHDDREAHHEAVSGELADLAAGEFGIDASPTVGRRRERSLEPLAVGAMIADRAQTDASFRAPLAAIEARLADHPRSSSGAYLYSSRFPNRVLLEGAYCFAPLAARLAGRASPAADEALAQLSLLVERMRDPATGLYAHGWDESRKQLWAQPEHGRSLHCYSWANALFALALTDVATTLDSSHPEYAAISSAYRDFAKAIADARCDGLWPVVLDQPHRQGNGPDGAASSLFIASLARGARSGALDGAFLTVAIFAYETLVSHISIDEQTGLKLPDFVERTSLAESPEEDGSFHHYVSLARPRTDARSRAALLLASAELIPTRR